MTATLMLLAPAVLMGAPAPAPRPVMGIVPFESRTRPSGPGWVGAVLTEALGVRLERLHRWRRADPARVAGAALHEKAEPGGARKRRWGVRTDCGTCVGLSRSSMECKGELFGLCFGQPGEGKGAISMGVDGTLVLTVADVDG